MTITPAQLGQVALTGSDQVVYVSPPGVITAIRVIDVCNTTPGTPRLLTCYLVPPGWSPSDGHAIAKGLEVTRNASKGILTLPAGWSIVARSDAPGLTMTVSGSKMPSAEVQGSDPPSQLPGSPGTNSLGSTSALLAANSPAITGTAPYTWMTVITADGSIGYIPIWK